MLGFVTPPDVSKSFKVPPSRARKVDVSEDPATLTGLIAVRATSSEVLQVAGRDCPPILRPAPPRTTRAPDRGTPDAHVTATAHRHYAAATFTGIDVEFFDAVIDASEVAVRQRRPGRVLASLRLAAAIGQLNEPVHASLVTTLAAAGHQAEALAVYRAIRVRLSDDLGIDPGPDLRNAQRQALNQTAMPPAQVVVPEQFPAVPGSARLSCRPICRCRTWCRELTGSSLSVDRTRFPLTKNLVGSR
jgi:hypothetical protein